MRSILSFFLLIITSQLLSQNFCTLEGRITDNAGKAIPYSSIYLPDISKGSMANIDGEFSISVPCGEYKIIIQSLGYEIRSIDHQINTESTELNIELNTVAYQLKEVTIDPSSEDPAYNIIRKATVMAEFYKKQIEEYQCRLYIKSFYNVEDLPWIAEKLADEKDLAQIKAGDIRETILEYSFKRPNIVKEKILAEKVASNDTSRSGSSYINLNFYNLGGSDIINPLSKNAFQVYKFEYVHTEFQGSNKVHKIKIIPRRKGSDLMKGFIYINHGLWNLNHVDVEFDQTLATIKYKQLYQKVDSNVWMPINHQIKLKLSAMGAKMDLQYLATLSDLKVVTNPKIDDQIRKNINLTTKENKKVDSIPQQKRNASNLSKTESKIQELIQKEDLTNKETIKLVRLIKKQERETDIDNDNKEESLEIGSNKTVEYNDNAFADNDSLWNTEREIPLSNTESSIYKKRDSLNKIESGDTVINKKRSVIGNIFAFDGVIKSKNKNILFRPNGIIKGLGGYFNTVDGFLINKRLLTYEWNNRQGKYYRITPIAEYAFARETFLGRLEFSSQYNPKTRGRFNFSVGRSSIDFDSNNPMGTFNNSISTLILTENYKKLFQQDYFTLEHRFDISNGFVLTTTFDYADRTPLSNNSNYKMFNFSNEEYTENIPIHQDVLNDNRLIEANKSSSFSLQLSYTHKHYYSKTERGEKIMLSSKYPTIDINYKQGIDNFLGSEVNFSLLSFAIHQSTSLGLIDQINYHLETGKFLNNQSLFFADYKNFNSQPFYFLSNQEPNAFKLLNPYIYSTNDYYFEGHFSVEDKHILLKYLPLLNRTNLVEKLHFNYFITERNENYYETGYSLNNIFFLMNIGAYVNFIDNRYESFGVRLGFNFNQ